MELSKETSISGVLDVQHGIVVPPGVLQTLLPEVSSILKNDATASSEKKQNQNNVLKKPSSNLLMHVILFCKVCDKPCVSQSVLNRHMKLHCTVDNVKQLYCKSCKLRQTCPTEVVHMETYVAYFANCYSCMKSLSMFICKQRGKSIVSLEEVIKHIESVTKCKEKFKNKVSSVTHKQSHRSTTKKPRKVSKTIDVVADVKRLKSYTYKTYLNHSEKSHRVEIDVKLTDKQDPNEKLLDIEKRAIEKDLNEYLTKKSNHICVLETTNTKITEYTKEVSEFTKIEHGIVHIKEEPSKAEFQDTAKKKHEEILAKCISKKTDHRELVDETDTKVDKDTKKPFELIYTEDGIIHIKEEPPNVEFLDTVKNKQEEILNKYVSKITDHRELAYERVTKFTENVEEPSESIYSEHGIVTIKEEPSNVEFLDTPKMPEVLDKDISKKTDHRELAYETETKFSENSEEPSESISSEHGIVYIKQEPSNVEFLNTQKKDSEEKHRELEVERDAKMDEDTKKLSKLVYMEPDIINIKEESSDVEFVSVEETSAEEREFGINPGKLSDIEFVSSEGTSSTVEREFGRNPGKSPDVEFVSVEKTTSTDKREFGLNPGKSSVIEFVSSEGSSSTAVKEFSKNPGKRKCYKLLCLTHQPKVSTGFKDASTAGSNTTKKKQIHKTIVNELACQNCAMCFSTQQELDEHIDKHGYTCKKCYEPFDCNKDLFRHFCLFCEQCEKVYNNKSNFLVHMKKHAVITKKTLISTCSKNDSLIKCNLIDNNYFKRQDYWCDACKEGFDDDFSFTSHKRFHGGPAKSYAVRKAPKLADATANGKTKLDSNEVKVNIKSSDFEFIKPQTRTNNRNFSSNNIPREKLKSHCNLVSDGGKCERFAEPEFVKIEPFEFCDVYNKG